MPGRGRFGKLAQRGVMVILLVVGCGFRNQNWLLTEMMMGER